MGARSKKVEGGSKKAEGAENRLAEGAKTDNVGGYEHVHIGADLARRG
jgi:hypothetical protein